MNWPIFSIEWGTLYFSSSVQTFWYVCQPYWYEELSYYKKSENGRPHGNRSFRQRSFRKRLWSVRKRVEVSSQTFRSQFANVINIDMSTYVLTVQFRILTLCLNYWVWNLTLQTFTCQPGFNYTIQNTTLLTRCMRKLLDVNSHSLFPAKVYFLIKWIDKSIGYKHTAILKLLYLNPVL